MNYDHMVSEPEDEVHFILVWHATEEYSVDMPLAGTEDRSARVFTGTLHSCLDFIRRIT